MKPSTLPDVGPTKIAADNPPVVAATRSGGSPTSLGQKAARKLKRLVGAFGKQAKKRLVRAAYATPGLSRRDPRRNIIRFKDACPLVADPPSIAGSPKNWYLKVRSPEVVTRQDSILINEVQAAQFRAGNLRYQSGNELELPEVFLAGVIGAKIYSKDLLLLSADNQIFFESALSRSDYLEGNGILDTLFHPPLQRLDGEYFLLANRSTRGYYHWLVDVLPKLALVEPYPNLAALPLIVPSTLQSFHHESLQRLGVPEEQVVRLVPGFWQADSVVFPEILAPTGSISPHAVAWLRRRFLNEIPTSPAPNATASGRRIYLTRRDATQRRVLNEAEIIPFLLSEGFEVVCPGDLSFADQVELFRNVNFVIAPHGAGATNLVFSPRGVTLLELFGDNYINGCFWALANLCGHRHAALIGRSTWLDYEIPLEDLKSLLRQLA